MGRLRNLPAPLTGENFVKHNYMATRITRRVDAMEIGRQLTERYNQPHQFEEYKRPSKPLCYVICCYGVDGEVKGYLKL